MEFLKEHIQKNSETWIYYDIDRRIIDINGSSYRVGEPSFSEVGGAVKSVLKELFGEYRTVPYVHIQLGKPMRTRNSGQRCSLWDLRDT